VVLGRAWAHALAARGEAGVSQMLAIMKEELEIAMALTGQSDARALDSDLALTGP
jgi:L-lactate dehydrogenase (cytochrome)